MATIVQAGVASHSAGATSIAQAYAGAVTSGNRLITLVSFRGTLTLTDGHVTDTVSNTWALDYHAALSGAELGFYSCVANGNNTPTVTFNPAASARLGIVVWELSGLDDHGGSVRNGASGTSTAPDSGAFTPTAATGIVFASYGGTNAVTWETDYLTGAIAHSSNSRWASAYDLAPAASSQTASGTISSAAWQMAACWYPDSAGGGGRTTKNTRAFPLGMAIGMDWRS